MSINAKLGDVLRAVVQSGADFADLYFEVSASHSFSFEDGAFEEISSSSSEGVGARVIREGETSHSYAPGVDLSTAFRCLEDAAEGGGIPLADHRLPSVRVMDSDYRFPSPEHSFFHVINERLRARSMWIRQISMNLNTADKRFNVFNSDGVIAGDRRQYTIFSVEVVVEKGGVLQTGYESEAFSVDSAEFFKTTSPLKVANSALARALLMLDAPMCPAGTMPVMLSGEAGGTMIHEACGHGFEADIIQKEFSVYRDKIGKQVASPLISMVDDGTILGYLGSGACDEEGTPCKRNILIDRGVAVAYITDVSSSRRGGIPLTGNGRRSSYRTTPLPRMTNTFVAPGESSPEAMIRSMNNGLLVKKMGGGEVDPTSGDFVFHVTEGYLVKDGRVSHPVRGAVLAGNGPETLMNIEAVGDDLHFLPGMCGKSGQNVPVTDGQPSLLIRNITVGGAQA